MLEAVSRCSGASRPRAAPTASSRAIDVAELADEIGQVAGQREHEQLLLGGEVAVDQRLVDAHRARDVLDRRVLQAAFVEQQARRGEDLALALAPCSAARLGTGAEAAPSPHYTIDNHGV